MKIKILFFIYCSLPLLWILSALLCAGFYLRPIAPCLWGVAAGYYIYYGLALQVILLIFLLYTKKISSKTAIIGIAITLIGIFATYYFVEHNTWNVGGWLSD